VRVLLATLLLVVPGLAADKADKLVSKATQAAKGAEADWKRFILERATFTDEDLARLVDIYDDVLEMLNKALDIKDIQGVNQQIITVAKRVAKLRFEGVRRKRAKQPPPAKPKPPPDKPKPGKTDPAPELPPDKPEPPPEDIEDEEPDETPSRTGPYPDLLEDKKAARKGKQKLRSWIMGYYFANRKFTELISRCSRCNGRGRIPHKKDPRTRKIIFTDCPGCPAASGSHLDVNAARRAFWLSMSPTHRAVPKNRQDFFEQLNQWNADPRKLGEFWKSMSIRDIDYHGNWAIVKFSLKGHSVRVRGSFKRDVTQMFFRIGKRWFVFDEKTDDAWLRPPED
jgi:hypothetical protein